ncbi:phytanoyl-CoA dioxygenase PhyH [Murinocardiopsis flavida]|uniref:Phytanoyl-CoA dioxygenase PhyH n=1 Tax=Murinocardiopsis flavida TaxID=645275 RepID=A0A2P8DEJ5_9ACTN|nr:phytanoyl-CoA dioxygenase family protein [Murinocardiopsis flavida]PSK95640.1 phytanoyl-CoA dioxygenase PhyH [Murinocardiopsis flavida]
MPVSSVRPVNISRYTRLGYAHVGPWADRAEVDALRAGIDPAAPVTANPHLTLPAIGDLVCSPEVTATARAVIGDALLIENTFLIIKAPGADMVVPPHQDGTNDHLTLDPARAVTLWLALTPASADAGCLRVAPGSHAGGYRRTRRADTPGRPLTIAGPPPGVWTAAPVEAGHGLAMDPRLVHFSPANRTATPRVGLNIRFVTPAGAGCATAPTPPTSHPSRPPPGDRTAREGNPPCPP